MEKPQTRTHSFSRDFGDAQATELLGNKHAQAEGQRRCREHIHEGGASGRINLHVLKAQLW